MEADLSDPEDVFKRDVCCLIHDARCMMYDAVLCGLSGPVGCQDRAVRIYRRMK